MQALFVTFGITIVTLIVILLWFVPHLMHQQARRAAHESAQLREMLLEMLGEQEMIVGRQGKMRDSLSSLRQQLEILKRLGEHGETPTPVELQQLDNRIRAMQLQIEKHMRTVRANSEKDNESWAYLISLQSAILERIGELSTEPRTMSRCSQEKLS